MTVLLLVWVAACDRRAPDAPAIDAPTAPSASDLGSPGPSDGAASPGGAERTVEIVLERGRIAADGWVTEPAAGDRLLAPAAEAQAPDDGGGRRWVATLPPGPGVARVARAGCGPVEVPYTVGPVAVVVLPYPTCDAPSAGEAPAVPGTRARLDRDELPWGTIEALHGLELFTDLPAPALGEEDGPARWIDLAEARALCAWRGGRLPTRAEWEAARAGATGTPVADATRDRLGAGAVGSAARALAGVTPLVSASGHRDLDGNVEEWLADGTVAGGSWVSRPEELGGTRAVPGRARAETIGVRCAFD